MKNIAIITPSLREGGLERVAANISNLLIGEYNVFLFVMDGNHGVYKSNASVVDFGLPDTYKRGNLVRLKFLFLSFIKLLYYKSKFNINVCISHGEITNIQNVLTFKSKNIVCIHENRMHADNDFQRRLVNKMIGRIYSYASYIVSVSYGVQNFLSTRYKFNNQLLKVIYNPFDIHSIEIKSRGDIEPTLKEIFANYKTVVNVGRFTRQKGHEHLIRIFAKLVKKYGTRYKLLLLGDGPDKEKIVKQIQEAGLKVGIGDNFDRSANVILLGFRENPYKYIANSDLFLSTSLWEGLPSVIIESLVCGTPVIHSDCPSGPREILADSETQNPGEESYMEKYGVLLPSYNMNDKLNQEDLDALYLEYIVKLFEDTDIMNEYSRRGKVHSREFSDHKVKGNWEHLINN